MKCQPRHRQRGLSYAAGALAIVLLVGCGSAGGDSDGDAVTGSHTEQSTGTAGDAAAHEAAAVDACGLLSSAEVESYLGASVEGSPGGGVTENSCTWRNADTGESATLSIYEPRSAQSGDLPEPSDYGDTEEVSDVGGPARFVPGFNIVEFIAGNRACEIQVAVLDEANARKGAIALARLVRERI